MQHHCPLSKMNQLTQLTFSLVNWTKKTFPSAEFFFFHFYSAFLKSTDCTHTCTYCVTLKSVSLVTSAFKTSNRIHASFSTRIWSGSAGARRAECALVVGGAGGGGDRHWQTTTAVAAAISTITATATATTKKATKTHDSNNKNSNNDVLKDWNKQIFLLPFIFH